MKFILILRGLSQCKNSALNCLLPEQFLWKIQQRQQKWLLRWEISTKRLLLPLTVQKIYGLQVLSPNIQTAQHNTTRFVAVSRKNFYTEHANKNQSGLFPSASAWGIKSVTLSVCIVEFKSQRKLSPGL